MIETATKENLSFSSETSIISGQSVSGSGTHTTSSITNNANIKEYLLDYKFPVEGFNANGDDVWIIDFISVGGMRNTAIGFRKLKSMLSKEGYSQAFWFRTETSKLGFHDWS